MDPERKDGAFRNAVNLLINNGAHEVFDSGERQFLGFDGNTLSCEANLK